MFDIDFTFVWTAINLAIVYFIVNKFLFKKLGAFMEQRSLSISSDIENGETLKSEGEKYRFQHEALLAEAETQRKDIINKAKLKASQEYENIINEAKKDANRILQEAREEGNRELEKLQKELQHNIAALVVSAASKVIEVNMDNEKNRELVNHFLSSQEVA